MRAGCCGLFSFCHGDQSCLNLGCLQDEILRRAVAYYGAKNWKRIGTPAPGTPCSVHVWAGRPASGPAQFAEGRQR